MNPIQISLTLAGSPSWAAALSNFGEHDAALMRSDPEWERTTRFANELGLSDPDRMRLLALTLHARVRRAELALNPPRPNSKELRRLLDE